MGKSWVVADGVIICEGGSDTGPGPILFVLRAPMGTSRSFPHELLAEYASALVKAVNAHDGLVKALERMTQTFKPFTLKPVGGEGSQARLEQQDQIEAHREALAALEGK